MFTRNKMVGWSAVIFAVQGWLNETPGQLASGKQPAYFSVGMSFMALAMVCSLFFSRPEAGECADGMQSYLPLFVPSMAKKASPILPPKLMPQ